MKLRSLFVKPTIACSADCIHCRRRRELYRKIAHEKKLQIDDYRLVFKQAKPLGVDSLHISGGEPTLYPDLQELISEGKRQNWFVILNTNGSQLNESLASKLLMAGLDAVIISLQGACPMTHDLIRQRDGHWTKALDSIRLLQEMGKKYNSSFLLTTQTIVTRFNYRELPDILQIVAGLGSDAHGFSYLEGDFDGESLLTTDEIVDFRNNILPRMLDRLSRHSFSNTLFRYAAMRCISKLYSEKINSLNNYARGVYRELDCSPSKCHAPNSFAMILPNGEVHPCNMVEYVHEPVMGNIFKNKLVEIWEGPEWNSFRQEKFKWCQFCPTHLHFHIPLNVKLRQILRLVLKNPAPEQKSIKERVSAAIFH